MRARVSSFVAAAALILSLGLQTSVMAAATAPLVLGSRGLDVAHLGSREVVAEQAFTQLLGRPSTPLTSTPGLSNCGLDAMSSWHAFSAYFDHGRLVGLSLGPGVTPFGRTSNGLAPGNTLARARVLYGASLRTSTNQGGTWIVTTSTGRIEGFLNPSTGRAPKPSARILTIDVGVVGCPAMSPSAWSFIMSGRTSRSNGV
jgi:hypothetical protein